MRGFVAALVLIVIGVAIAAAAGNRTALLAAGVFIAGVGGVVGVSAAFWIIGRSEDEERERRQGKP
jgi:hypothetical protein